jgi:eukaryotic-like serine/threonine-protein kinase
MIGTILRGRYQITSRLGGGGFAETYLAKDLDIKSNPLCVVKRLKPALADPDLLAIATRLFQTESEVLYKLKHDLIPRLLADFMEDGEFYLIQEYIDGDDLSKTELAGGKILSESEVTKLLKDILEVLAFVHQQNVIHRDLKPSNLIRDRHNGKLFLIDFGAVKQIQTVASQALQNTVGIGTKGYMPNEQAGGFPVPASDIYAVGAIAIQALTGILPQHFHRDTNNREIVWRDRVQVSPKLATILDKMVLYDAHQRYPSAVEALAAINALSPRKKGFSQLVYWGLAGAIALLAAIGLYLFYNSRSPVLDSTRSPELQTALVDYNWTAPNSRYKIHLKYPETWTIESGAYPSTPDIDTLVFPENSPTDKSDREITINSEKLDRTILLAEYTKELTNRLKQRFPQLQFLDKCENDIILSGNPTQTICYQLPEQNNNIKYLVAVTLHSDRAYYLIYKSEESQYDRSLNLTKNVFRSFQITPVNSGL